MGTPLGPAYRIETARTVVRCWNPPDAVLLKAAIDRNLDHLRPWMPWAANEPEPLEAKMERLRLFRGRFDLGEDFAFGIFTPDESRVVGAAGLHTRQGPDTRELGYWMDRDLCNQGYITEVAAALTRVAFDIDGVHRAELHCSPDNHPSAAIARKLGFTHEATLRARFLLPSGVYRDTMIFTLLRSEYAASPAATASFKAYDAAGQEIVWTPSGKS